MTGKLVGILIVTALAAQFSRIAHVRSPTGETPFHSANDRSRWCAVAALGGYGQFEIDPFLELRDPKTKRRTWATIDLVRHRGRDGKQHYYSSKPPLLSAMHASVYAAVRLTTGLSLLEQTFTTARVILVLVSLIPLAMTWWLWGGYWQRQSLSQWALAVAMTFMLWGTFISSFANTLNNHVPGAIAAGVSLLIVLKIIEDGQRQWRWFVLAGMSAAMAAVCELPALSWVAAVYALLIPISPKRAAIGLTAGALPLAIAFVVINVLAHGDLRPPYAHRAKGELITSLARDQMQPAATANRVDANAMPAEAIMPSEWPRLIGAVRELGYEISSQAQVRSTRTPGVDELWDERTHFRFALVASTTQIDVHHWDDWYDYPNSYWYPDRKQGVDRGEPSRGWYLLQATFGHHGIFSLTPMWLLLPLGFWTLWQETPGQWRRRLFEPRVQLMLAIGITSLVCFAFYMLRPLADRNYGGVSSGFRWMFWFTPLWCWVLAHALNRIRTRWSRRLVLAALAVSIFSATYPWDNPWTAPWLFQLF